MRCSRFNLVHPSQNSYSLSWSSRNVCLARGYLRFDSFFRGKDLGNIIFRKRQLPVVAGYGLSLGAMNLLFYFSLERIPLGIAVALEFTGPLAVSLFYSRKAIDLIWIVLAGVGIYLLLPISSVGGDSLDITGIVLALLAGFFLGTLYLLVW